MTLFNVVRSLDADAQAHLAETRRMCAEMVDSMPDPQKYELFLACKEITDRDDVYGVAGTMAMLGFMETMCNIAKIRVQESN